MPPAPTIDSRLRLVELALFGIHPEADAATRQACAEEHCGDMVATARLTTPEAVKPPTPDAPVEKAPADVPDAAPPAARPSVPVAPPLDPLARKGMQERCVYLEALNGRRENAIKSCRERALADDTPGKDHWNVQADNLKLLQDVDGKTIDKLKLELA